MLLFHILAVPPLILHFHPLPLHLTLPCSLPPNPDPSRWAMWSFWEWLLMARWLKQLRKVGPIEGGGFPDSWSLSSPGQTKWHECSARKSSSSLILISTTGLKESKYLSEFNNANQTHIGKLVAQSSDKSRNNILYYEHTLAHMHACFHGYNRLSWLRKQNHNRNVTMTN